MVLSGRFIKSVLDWGTESYKCVSVSWWCVSGDGVFSVSVSWWCVSDGVFSVSWCVVGVYQ